MQHNCMIAAVGINVLLHIVRQMLLSNASHMQWGWQLTCTHGFWWGCHPLEARLHCPGQP